MWGIDSDIPHLTCRTCTFHHLDGVFFKDVTCDSDGRIDMYVDELGVETTLPLPEPPVDKPYLLGFFLTGAYQEILGICIICSATPIPWMS